MSPSHWAYQPDVQRYPYDPDRAGALLDDGDPDDLPREACAIFADAIQPVLEQEFLAKWAQAGGSD